MKKKKNLLHTGKKYQQKNRNKKYIALRNERKHGIGVIRDEEKQKPA